MFIGVLKVELYIPSIRSLKEKRKEIKSMKEKIRNNFNVSVSEVDGNDLWQRAVLGISVTGRDFTHIQSVVDRITEFLEKNWSHLILEISADFIKV